MARPSQFQFPFLVSAVPAPLPAHIPATAPSSRAAFLWLAALITAVPVIVFAANGTIIILGLCAFAAPALPVWRTALKEAMRTPPGLALAALAIWIIISIGWSAAPADSAATAARLLLLWLAGLTALAGAQRNRAPQNTGRALAIAYSVILLLYVLEIAGGGPLISLFKQLDADHFTQFSEPAQREAYRLLLASNAIGRGGVLLVLLIWPVAALLSDSRAGLSKGNLVLALLLGATIWLLLQLPVGAAPLALLVGIAAYGSSFAAPYRLPQLIGIAAAALLLAMPIIAAKIDRPEAFGIEKRSIPPSWQHRIEIWHYTANRITEKPLTGWGFDGARHIDAKATQFVAELPDGSDIAYPNVTLLPLHPHNGALQIWLELGLPGALLAAALLVALGFHIGALPLAPAKRAAATAAFSATFSLILLSFGLWQNWWQASFWLLLILFGLVCQATRSSDEADARPGPPDR